VGHGITVVGSLNADLVVSVRRFPTPGETVTGQGFAVFSGGKGANQAYGVARLAAGQLPVRMVGRVGNDAYGAWLRQNLHAARKRLTKYLAQIDDEGNSRHDTGEEDR